MACFKGVWEVKSDHPFIIPQLVGQLRSSLPTSPTCRDEKGVIRRLQFGF
jgi:hypothetical protein